jgi:uncharacterized protein YyaL (SSP411 family)
VDWHPWDEAAFARAAAENKPIFLSIGYATCHWCHVMEKESFEDEEAARALNDTFVCIKVDREERPDIDAVYMAACHLLSRSGGWPLTVFMTPDRKPFFAATYIPKRSRFGRAGLIELCGQVKSLWIEQPQRIAATASGVTDALGKAFEFAADEAPGLRLLDRAYDDIAFSFDGRHGGFEPAPKFPTPHRLSFLLRCHDRTADPRALEMVTRTLTAMRLGGIWDHVGFGLHRYSTDGRWLLPHFEKMLYDQALTATACLEASQVSRDPLLARTAEEIFTYVERDMTSPEGAFFSAEDADSEGVEGKFYVWTLDEFRRVLGPEEAAVWEPVFNLKPEGNFREEAGGHATGANILHLTRPLDRWAADLGVTEEPLRRRWEDARGRLFAARQRRIHPLKDDKILADWNGLMAAALARAGRILHDERALGAALAAIDFVRARMRSGDGRLLHRYRSGAAAVPAFLDDYAFLGWASIELYDATFDPTHLERALELTRAADSLFRDPDGGGYFSTATDSERLLVRQKEVYDGAIPSGNSVAMSNLVRLSRLTGDPELARRADAVAIAFARDLAAAPAAHCHLLSALQAAANPSLEIVIAGDPRDEATRRLVEVARSRDLPDVAVLLVPSGEDGRRVRRLAPFTEHHAPIDGKAAAYVCRGFTCLQPTTDPRQLASMLEDAMPDRRPGRALGNPAE